MIEEYQTITMDEINFWTDGIFDNYAKEYLLEILRGDYNLKEAREDILSLRNYKNNDK